MNLQEVQEKLKDASDENIRAEEKVKVLKERKKDLDKKLKKHNVESIDKIDAELKTKEIELKGLMNKLEGVESEVLLDEKKESELEESIEVIDDLDKEINRRVEEESDKDLFDGEDEEEEDFLGDLE